MHVDERFILHFSGHLGISHQSMSAQNTGDTLRVSLHALGLDHGRRRNAHPGGTERGLRKNPLRAIRPQLSPLNGRQMIFGRGADVWHGIPRFAIILPCPTEWVSVFSMVDGPSVRLIFSLAFLTGAPSARAEHQQLGPPGTNGPYTFCLHPLLRGLF